MGEAIRPMTRMEVLRLPAGLIVFVETPSADGYWPSEKHTVDISPKDGRVYLRDKEGYAYNPMVDTMTYGRYYRVWHREPTDEERAANPWPEVV